MTTSHHRRPATVTNRPARLLCLTLLSAQLLTACSNDPDGRFDAQPATPTPSCLPHQTRNPGSAYTGGRRSDPAAVLEMMRFYTANRTKAYCDGQPASDRDRRWTSLYTELGGDARHVPRP
ncbi:hypothetical protein ACFCX4_06405 [Kitasatospora sp. NPDC056327]|uniref:hypothetical protein n=1 Tax=Kitasatospora sp. NPDC056327 TaxID=3345785 RepID=UPI0035DC98F8